MYRNLKDILVPVDFKDASINALKYAKQLSGYIKGKITLLYVVKNLDIIGEMFRSKDELVQITGEAHKRLEGLVKDHKLENVDIKIEKGHIHEKIIEYAEKTQARIIVLGDNHAFMGESLGPNTTLVIRSASCPVIVVKKPVEKLFQRMVVPLDLNRENTKQVFAALSFGTHYNAEVHFVSVLIGGVRLRQSRIYKKMKKIKGTLEENGLKVHTKIYERSEEPSYKKVLEYANEVSADVILLMSHNEKQLADNYIGAFALQIISESQIPIISLTNKATKGTTSDVMKGFVDPFKIIYGN